MVTQYQRSGTEENGGHSSGITHSSPFLPCWALGHPTEGGGAVCTGALLRLQVQFPTELGEAALGLHKAAAGQPLHEREDTKSRCSHQTSASHSDLQGHLFQTVQASAVFKNTPGNTAENV